MSSKTEYKTEYLAAWPFSKMADVEADTANDHVFMSFLLKASLENFHDAFIKQGVEKIEHLQDIDEEDATEFGLSKIQLKRLKREYALWNADKTKSTPPPSSSNTSSGGTSYKTSSSSVVLSLRPGFKDFFHTRDGQGNIVVSAKALKIKKTRTRFKRSLIHLFYKWLNTGCSFQTLLENANFGVEKCANSELPY